MAAKITKMKNLIKYPSLFLTGYFSQNLIQNYMKVEKSYTDPSAQQFKNYLENNKLKRSSAYEQFRSQVSQNSHFVEKAIKNDLQGLGLFNVYFPEEVSNKLESKQTLTEEEKLNLGKIYCIFSPNSAVQGHISVAHGGFTATIIDNVLGVLSGLVSDYQPSATAYLNVNYKKPIKTGHEYMMVAEVEKIQGKKNFLKVSIVNEKMEKCVEADALFVKVDWQAQFWKKMTAGLTEVTKKEASITAKDIIYAKDVQAQI